MYLGVTQYSVEEINCRVATVTEAYVMPNVIGYLCLIIFSSDLEY